MQVACYIRGSQQPRQATQRVTTHLRLSGIGESQHQPPPTLLPPERFPHKALRQERHESSSAVSKKVVGVVRHLGGGEGGGREGGRRERGERTETKSGGTQKTYSNTTIVINRTACVDDGVVSNLCSRLNDSSGHDNRAIAQLGQLVHHRRRMNERRPFKLELGESLHDTLPRFVRSNSNYGAHACCEAGGVMHSRIVNQRSFLVLIVVIYANFYARFCSPDS